MIHFLSQMYHFTSEDKNVKDILHFTLYSTEESDLYLGWDTNVR